MSAEARITSRSSELYHRALDLTISVNLSARQLRDARLVADVAATLRDTGLAPRSLTLEITETVLMDNTGGAIDRLHQLKALGVRLAKARSN